MQSMYSLLIGINNYQEIKGLSLEPLLGSVHDADSMADLLKERFGAAARIRKRIAPHRGTGQPPTLEVIRTDLAEILQSVRAGDQVLIYFSGHGLRLPTLRIAEGGPPFDECLVLAGATNPIEKAVLRDLEIAAWVRAAVEKEVLVTLIVDCCHSGGAAKDLDEIESTSWLGLPDDHRGLICKSRWLPETSKRMVFLASCQPHQQSHQKFVGTKFQGCMTGCLVEILRSQKTEATWDLVHRHVVAAVHREIGYQTPYLEGERDRLALGWGYGSTGVAKVEGLGLETPGFTWVVEPSLGGSLGAAIEALAADDDLLQLSIEKETEADLIVERLRDGRLLMQDPGGETLLTLRSEATADEVFAALQHLARFHYVSRLENPLSTIWRCLELGVKGEDGEHILFKQWADGTDPRGYVVALQAGVSRELTIRNRGNRVIYFTLFDLQPGWEISQVYPEESWNIPLEPDRQENILIDMEIGLMSSEAQMPRHEVLMILVATEACDFRAFELNRWCCEGSDRFSKSLEERFAVLRQSLEQTVTRSRSLAEGAFWDWTVERIYLERIVGV